MRLDHHHTPDGTNMDIALDPTRADGVGAKKAQRKNTESILLWVFLSLSWP
jgi:hypothetical protein